MGKPLHNWSRRITRSGTREILQMDLFRRAKATQGDGEKGTSGEATGVLLRPNAVPRRSVSDYFGINRGDRVLNGSISNIEFRWLRYRATKEKVKVRVPISTRLTFLGSREVEQEVVRYRPPSLQYRLFSDVTREWTGWVDVPFVDEGDLGKAVTSNARLRAEYGDLSDPMFKLDIG